MKKARKIELSRYAGKWNQVAAFPAWFDRGCKNITAEYELKKGYVKVTNRCTLGPIKNKIVGKAFPTNKQNVLMVQFYPPVKSPYIIEYVDEEYKFAVVGSQNKNYLWILSRRKRIKKEDLDYLVSYAKKKGYDVSRLVFA